MLSKFERHITIVSEQSSIINTLSEHCTLSKAILKQAIDKGALWLTRNGHTQRLRRLKKTLKAQDVLHFYYDPLILDQEPAAANLIADLNDYSVWFKPYGMLSQGSKWSDHCSIQRWAQKNLLPERACFIVHRLDKAATGLIIIAHSKKSAKAFSAMFENRQLEKHYQIIVHGDHSQRPQPDIITDNIEDKKARSTFSLSDYNSQQDLSLINVKIDTGRKHQIRRHAASIQLPIVGDRLHGDTSKSYPNALNLQLCAVSLSFICPLSGQPQAFHVPSPLRPNLGNVVKLLT